MRRILGSPRCAVCGLVLLAILVVGGLGWVSVASLRVEESQRRSAAQAQGANRERTALWRLDSHMLAPLGLENNRPYSHYTALHAPSSIVIDDSGSPAVDPGRVPSPLLGSDLRDWAILHVQIDPNRGWQSPQVIPADLANRLKTGPLELSLANVTPERAQLLDDLRTAFPTPVMLKKLVEQDRILPIDEAYIVPVPLADEPSTEKPAPCIDMAPVGAMRDSGESWLVSEAAKEHLERFRADQGGSARRALYCELDENRDARKDAADQTKRSETEKKTPGLPADQQISPPALEPVVQIAPKPRELSPGEIDRDAMARKQAVNNASNSRGGYDIAPGGRNLNEGQSGKDPFANSNSGPEQTHQWIENLTKSIRDRAKGEAYKNPVPKSDGKKMAEPKLSAGTPVAPGAPMPSGGRADKTLSAGDEAARRFSQANLARAKVVAPRDLNTDDYSEVKPGPIVAPVAVHIGPMRPRWITDDTGARRLFLLRSVNLGTRVIYQGVVVDWPKLSAALKTEIADVFPDAELHPALASEEPVHERTMTALPVRLDTGADTAPVTDGWSPLRTGLVIAWAAAILAIGAVSFGGRAVVAMSERRIRFASAVTHELRTPLTAMQLHLDLLNSGLVRDDDKKAEFLATISSEALRLNQLVENVLAFAKLEKRSARAQAKWVPLESIRRTIAQTWAERLAFEGFELVVNSMVPLGGEVFIDPRVLEQVLGNLIDNARKYAKSAVDRRIWLWIKPTAGGRIAFEIEDRGPGIPAAERRSIFQIFRRGSSSTDTGGAGLGLSLAKQWAELFGGTLNYRPADGGTGACFRLELAAK